MLIVRIKNLISSGYTLLFVFATLVTTTCDGQRQKSADKLLQKLESYEFEEVVKSAEDWQKELSEEEYYVLREHGTERRFTGEYWDEKRSGIYTCRGCELPLFDSESKFVSGTGWPSFYIPKYKNTVEEEVDNQFGMVRTEVHCARCKGHLGHVFPDGPKPTGLRYCMNSLSLKFESSE